MPADKVIDVLSDAERIDITRPASVRWGSFGAETDILPEVKGSQSMTDSSDIKRPALMDDFISHVPAGMHWLVRSGNATKPEDGSSGPPDREFFVHLYDDEWDRSSGRSGFSSKAFGSTVDQALERALFYASQPIPPSKPDPSPAMIEAGVEVLRKALDRDWTHRAIVEYVYKAMRRERGK
jgi:hypothetical protein